MKKEHTVVLELVKYGNKKIDKLSKLLNDKTINWIEVLGYLCYHRVSGIAYETLNQIDVRKVDFSVFFSLYMIYESQSIRTNIQKEQIKIISSKLCEANIKHAFLKGSILSSILYSEGARTSNDIDILVSKRSILKVKELLSGLGFLQGKYDYKNNIINEVGQDELDKSLDTRGEMFPFVKILNKWTVKTVDVDINFSLNCESVSLENYVDYFLDQRITIIMDKDNSIYSLAEEHMFVHLCSHLYKDAVFIDIVTKRKVLDLYKFVDIYTFIQKYFDVLDIEKLYIDSVKFNFGKHIYFTLKYTSLIFPDILDISKVVLLLSKFSFFDDKVMNEIFDQYDQKNKMIDNGDLIERLFSYDIINRYTKI